MSLRIEPVELEWTLAYSIESDGERVALVSFDRVANAWVWHQDGERSTIDRRVLLRVIDLDVLSVELGVDVGRALRRARESREVVR